MRKLKLTLKHLNGMIVIQNPRNFTEAMEWLNDMMKECHADDYHMRPVENGILEGYFEPGDGDHVNFKLEEILI